MKSISIYRSVLKHFWLIFIIGCLTWLGLGVYEHHVRAPQYTSRAILAVHSANAGADPYTNLVLTSGMAETYAEIFTEPAIKTLAAGHLGLSEFDGRIAADVPKGTNFVTIDVSSDSPEHACALLNGVLEVSVGLSDTFFSDASIEMMQKPEPARLPDDVFTAAAYFFYSVMAMAGGCALVCICAVLRDPVIDETAFEETVGAARLGSVVHVRSRVPMRVNGKRVWRLPFVTEPSVSLRYFEDYQSLANKLESIRNTTGTAVFSVVSTAEKEDASMTVCNLALSLVMRGYRTALVDCHIRNSALHALVVEMQTQKTVWSEETSDAESNVGIRVFRYRSGGQVFVMTREQKAQAGVDVWTDRGTETRCPAFLRDQVDYILMNMLPLSVSADAVSVSAAADSADADPADAIVADTVGILLAVRSNGSSVRNIRNSITAISNAGGTMLGCILHDVRKPCTWFGMIGNDEYGAAGQRFPLQE